MFLNPFKCGPGWYLFTLLGVLLGLSFGVSQPVCAQMSHLDELPWFAPADSTSRLALIIDLDRTADSKFGWYSNRLQLTCVLPAGRQGAFFVRMPYVVFDTGQIPVVGRWPWIRGEKAVGDWPHEQRISSFGRPELGVIGPLDLPGFGRIRYGVGLGLPAGSDELYPISSKSFPLRFEGRKYIVDSPGVRVGATAGYVLDMASGGKKLTDAAFPSGYHLGLNLDRILGRGQRWSATWDYHNRSGHKSQLVGAQIWLPWTQEGSLGFKVAREVQGSLDRAAQWYFTVSIRLDSEPFRPKPVSEAVPTPEPVPAPAADLPETEPLKDPDTI